MRVFNIVWDFVPRHDDRREPNARYGRDHLAHVLRALLLRPDDKSSSVQRDGSDRDGRNEDRSRLKQSDHSACHLQKKRPQSRRTDN